MPRGGLAGALLLALLAACSRGEERSSVTSPPVPVVAAPAVQRPMPMLVGAVGHVRAAQSVTVRSLVTGTLARAHFVPGEDVAEAELLFTIDPRPFEARLQQARAELARNRATAEHARRQARRYAELLAQGLVARAEYDELHAEAAAAEAMVRADRAAVERARLELEYTRIQAPLAGRTGNRLVDAGNVVRANETELVVINQLRPILVAFAVPAEHLATIRARMEAETLPVSATPTGAVEPATGRVTFVDNRVDPQTATIRLEASFPNEDARLWPGQFTNVVLRLGVEEEAVVVPSAAVQEGQAGSYVFVVTAEGVADARPVAVAWQDGDETVIARGVAPGDTVVTEGQLRLTPGARVAVERAPPPAASPRS